VELGVEHSFEGGEEDGQVEGQDKEDHRNGRRDVAHGPEGGRREQLQLSRRGKGFVRVGVRVGHDSGCLEESGEKWSGRWGKRTARCCRGAGKERGGRVVGKVGREVGEAL
jgi:hypothetical protein